MPVGGGILRDSPRDAATDGHQVNHRPVFFLRLIADGQPFRIRRNPMVIVAADREASIDKCRRAAVYRQSQNMAILLNKNAAPSRVQLGASKCSGAT